MTPLATLAGAWLCLVIGVLLSGCLPGPFALCASLALGNVWLFSSSGRGRSTRCSTWCFTVGVGFASYAGAAVFLDTAFAGLGWRCPAIEVRALAAAQEFSRWFLAPCFEEGLYRGRVFAAVARRYGGTVAVLSTSTLFAIVHVERCAVLASFLIGCVLGVARQRSGKLSVCIGAHCGLNLGATFWPRWWAHG